MIQIIENNNSIDNSKFTFIDTVRNSSSRETNVKYTCEQFINNCFINYKWKILFLKLMLPFIISDFKYKSVTKFINQEL